MARAEATLAAADLTLRPASLDDAAFASDVATAVHPDDPEDPKLWWNWWHADDKMFVTERFVALRDGHGAGYAMRRHAPDDSERFERLHADLLPDLRTPSRLDALFALLEGRAGADGPLRVTTWSEERDALLTDVLAARGYREERRQRFWELDLRKHRDRLARMAEESRERMRAQAIRILTVADDDDPEKWRKLWRMSVEAERDIPRSTPFVETPFEAFMEWMRSPGSREDRMWIARAGEDVVGISMLSYPPVRGIVATAWTATARSVRGKGVARALKCETVMQAMALGVPRVRTDNDFQNAPILHLNESMGYERLPGMVMFLKALPG